MSARNGLVQYSRHIYPCSIDKKVTKSIAKTEANETETCIYILS